MRLVWAVQLLFVAAGVLSLAGSGCGRSPSMVGHGGAVAPMTLPSTGGVLATGSGGATSAGDSGGTILGGASDSGIASAGHDASASGGLGGTALGGSGGAAAGGAAGTKTGGSGGAGGTVAGGAGGIGFGGSTGTASAGAGGAGTVELSRGGGAPGGGTATGGSTVLTGGTATGGTATGGLATGGRSGLGGAGGATGGSTGCATDCSTLACGTGARPVCDPFVRQCLCAPECAANPVICGLTERCLSVCSPGGTCVCAGTCVKEGEIGFIANCCPGLIQVGYYQDTTSCSPTSANLLVCAACGDEKCGLGENHCNCPQDCQ